MKPQGLRLNRNDKKRWQMDGAYKTQRTALMPTDFVNEREKHEKAASFLKGLIKSDVYIFKFLIETGKKRRTKKNKNPIDN